MGQFVACAADLSDAIDAASQQLSGDAAAAEGAHCRASRGAGPRPSRPFRLQPSPTGPPAAGLSAAPSRRSSGTAGVVAAPAPREAAPAASGAAGFDSRAPAPAADCDSGMDLEDGSGDHTRFTWPPAAAGGRPSGPDSPAAAAAAAAVRGAASRRAAVVPPLMLPISDQPFRGPQFSSHHAAVSGVQLSYGFLHPPSHSPLRLYVSCRSKKWLSLVLLRSSPASMRASGEHLRKRLAAFRSCHFLHGVRQAEQRHTGTPPPGLRRGWRRGLTDRHPPRPRRCPGHRRAPAPAPRSASPPRRTSCGTAHPCPPPCCPRPARRRTQPRLVGRRRWSGGQQSTRVVAP